MFSLSGNNTSQIEVEGKTYKLNLSFKRVMRAIEILDDTVLNEYDKVFLCYMCLVDKEDTNKSEDFLEVSEVVKEIFKFLAPNKSGKDEAIIFSWKEDAERVYSSFLQFYNIDLLEEDLDWGKFSALFNNLGRDTAIMEAVKYRSMPLPKGKHNRAEREHVRQMKEYYQLEAERERQDRIIDEAMDKFLNDLL